MSISEPEKSLLCKCLNVQEERSCLFNLLWYSQQNRAVKFCFWPQFSFIPHNSLTGEAHSHFTGGAADTLKPVSVQGLGSKLGSCVQESLLLREFGGMELKKEKGGRGTGQGHGVEWVGWGQHR